MRRYLEYLKMLRVDLEKDLEKYLEIIRNAAQRYEGKAYIFGSYVKDCYIVQTMLISPLRFPMMLIGFKFFTRSGGLF